MNSGGFCGADFSLRVGFSRRPRFLSNPANHRLKPMLQAEARATGSRNQLTLDSFRWTLSVGRLGGMRAAEPLLV
jgi:hypothetical protein